VGTWMSSSTAANASTCLGILLCLTTLVYVAYCLFFGGSRGWAPVLSRDVGHVAELMPTALRLLRFAMTQALIWPTG
jgi:hypothetical protein